MVVSRKHCVQIFRRNPDADVRLFCFPHSGAGASVFNDWHTLAPSCIEICPIQLPGRGTSFRETPIDNIEPLIDMLLHDIVDYMDKPFAFFGHSLGALLAYELTRNIASVSHHLPIHLFISAYRAPHLPNEGRMLHKLEHEELLAEIVALNGVPKELMKEPELVRYFMSVIRADLAVCETYVFRNSQPLPVSFTVYGGDTDPRAQSSELAPWRELCACEFDMKIFAGGHFYIESCRKELVDNIARALLTKRSC